MIALAVSIALAAVQPATPQKADIVSVTGCVSAGPGDTWLLTDATDPVPDERPAAGRGRGGEPAPASPPAAAAPTAGKNRYRLIGILELGVPDHKGQTVTIKGLLIAGSEKKINVTSVKMVAPSCKPQGR
jgi:hypothetical protein